MAKIKTTEASKCDKDTEQWDSRTPLLGMRNGTTGLETLEHRLDGRHIPTPAISSHSTPSYLPKTSLNICPRKNLDIHIENSFIHNSLKMETN